MFIATDRECSPRALWPACLAIRAHRSQLPFMGTSPLLTQILELPIEQRLQLVQEIWESLVRSEASVPVPPWHREELDRRLADPAETLTESWDTVQQRLNRLV